MLNILRKILNLMQFYFFLEILLSCCLLKNEILGINISDGEASSFSTPSKQNLVFQIFHRVVTELKNFLLSKLWQEKSRISFSIFHMKQVMMMPIRFKPPKFIKIREHHFLLVQLPLYNWLEAPYKQHTFLHFRKSLKNNSNYSPYILYFTTMHIISGIIYLEPPFKKKLRIICFFYKNWHNLLCFVLFFF